MNKLRARGVEPSEQRLSKKAGRIARFCFLCDVPLNTCEMLRDAIITPEESVTSLLVKILFMTYYTTKAILETCYYHIGLKVTNNASKVLLVFTPSIAATIAVLPLQCFLLALMWAYRVTVETVLSLREGEKFGGLLVGSDVVTIMTETNVPSLIYTVLLVDYSGSIGDFRDLIVVHLRSKLRKEPRRWWKLLTTRHTAYGYHYLRCNEVDIDDLVSIKQFHHDFNESFNKHALSMLPNGGLGNFDMAIFEKISEGYPVILRCHHCLGDGPSFYNIISDLFMTKGASNESYTQNLIKKLSQKGEAMPWKEQVWTLLDIGMNSLFVKDEALDLFNDVDSDPLFCLKWEKDGRYMAMVKAIRRRMPGVSFYAIVLGVYSASLSKYCVKKLKPENLPQHFSGGLPKQMSSDQVSGCYMLKDTAKFTNTMSLQKTLLMGIPSDKVAVPIEDYLVERIAFVQKQLNKAEKSVDLLVYYTYMVTYANVVPTFLISRLPSLFPVVAGSSGVPGGSEVHFSDHRLSNAIFLIPRLNVYGIGLSYLTYGDRLQLGLTAYSSRQSLEETNEILEDMFKYLEVLDEKSAKITDFQLHKFVF